MLPDDERPDTESDEPDEFDEQDGPVLWRGLLLAAGVLVVIAVGLTVFAVATNQDPPPRVPQSYTFTIPEGTAKRVAAGDIPDGIFPDKLVLNVGDTIHLVNQDTAQHVLATFTIRPGETIDYTFPQRGLYRGACTIKGTGHEALIQVNA